MTVFHLVVRATAEEIDHPGINVLVRDGARIKGDGIAVIACLLPIR